MKNQTSNRKLIIGVIGCGVMLLALGVAVFAGMMGSFFALIVAPDFHTRLISPLVCPEEMSLVLREDRVYWGVDIDLNRQRTTEISLLCEGEDGMREEGKGFIAIALWSAMYFAACLLLIGLVMLVLARRSRSKETHFSGSAF